nr:hypothetical protein [Neisseria yangbaofengii]
MKRRIIHHHHTVLRQLRNQNPLHPSVKYSAVNTAIKQPDGKQFAVK